MVRELEAMNSLFEVAKGLREPESQREQVYKELVYNRVEDFIRTSFPQFSRHGEEFLSALLREFVKKPHSSPLLIDLAREFFEFFREEGKSALGEIPFLEELLLYELTELELFNFGEDQVSDEFSWDTPFRLSKLSRLMEFEYPVHKSFSLSAEDMLAKRGKFFVLLYRGKDFEVKSVELTEFVATFLRDIDGGKTPLEALNSKALGDEVSYVKPYLEKFCSELVGLGVLVER